VRQGRAAGRVASGPARHGRGRRIATQGDTPVSDPIAFHSLEDLRDAVRAFVAERDWDQFHSPKNLATALMVEAAELAEHFQWLTEQQSLAPDPAKREPIEDELADVLVYLVRIADKLDVDLLSAARRKLAKNAAKYPADKARGRMTKYTDL
jgi:NTP pyrophosphatase (non-canonical NTP hydrolase)